MEVNGQIGEMAGEVWHLLSDAGPLTLAQIRRKLNRSSEFLNLALGWLAREEKVIVTQERRSLRAQLR
ncbi:MAG: winged helix-turn-helix domain-containing protein [Acidobacteriia bacterium]|nr:winged helix-turn-helix domain-containing protein [Terriglobia bacterium]